MIKYNEQYNNNLYKIKRSDLKKAEIMMTEAFSKDPYLYYLLDSDEYDKNKAKYLHNFVLKYGLKYGKVFATSKNIEGIIIWLPPDETDMTTFKSIKSGVISLKKKVHNRILKILDNYGKYSSALHKKYAPCPHWYLLSIAVDKAYQGKHLASKLLRPFLQIFDKDNYPCYLETHNANNLSIYKHYGFNIVEIGKLPGTDKSHWCMLRMPLKLF